VQGLSNRGLCIRLCVAMFSLIGGLLKWLCSKQELNMLIVGLDHAGKTVRVASTLNNEHARALHTQSRPTLLTVFVWRQTLLEQMKGMYNKSGTIPLDKIPPTIGLNGM